MSKPWEVVYRHAPSDGRPCQIVHGGGSVTGMTPVTHDGKVRVGFIDGPTPHDWNTVQFEWVPMSDLVATKEEAP